MVKQTSGGASDAPRATSSGRSESVKAALEKKRAGVTAEWHPCLWCGAAIPERRVKDAMLRNQSPKYCGEPCRRNEPAKSLVHRIYAAALGAHRSDESQWILVFNERRDAATAPIVRKKGGK